MKKKVLVVVAHPDDETIWMGGTILENIGKWDLTIISLCRRYDKDRAPRFKKVCRRFGAKCFMSDLEDEKLNPQSLNNIIKRVKKFTKKDYDSIFTHGKNGEYGHKRHIEVHNAVVEMLDKKAVDCKKIFFFSYLKKGRFCYPNPKSDKFIKLKEFYFRGKKSLIRDVYGFKKNGFEDVCCRNKESFIIEEKK